MRLIYFVRHGANWRSGFIHEKLIVAQLLRYFPKFNYLVTRTLTSYVLNLRSSVWSHFLKLSSYTCICFLLSPMISSCLAFLIPLDFMKWLFVLWFFNDTFSNSDYKMASNDWITVNNRLIGIWKELYNLSQQNVWSDGDIELDSIFNVQVMLADFYRIFPIYRPNK
jgi:hypothetical protein